jgi:hypothetical protein
MLRNLVVRSDEEIAPKRATAWRHIPVAAVEAKASGFETRKLAAILAADIVGRLTGADQDRTL